jgi:hypothetical protein
MNTENAAAQQHMAALAAQQLLCRLSDNPRQFTEPPLAASARTVGRLRREHSQVEVMACPF